MNTHLRVLLIARGAYELIDEPHGLVRHRFGYLLAVACVFANDLDTMGPRIGIDSIEILPCRLTSLTRSVSDFEPRQHSLE